MLVSKNKQGYGGSPSTGCFTSHSTFQRISWCVLFMTSKHELTCPNNRIPMSCLTTALLGTCSAISFRTPLTLLTWSLSCALHWVLCTPVRISSPIVDIEFLISFDNSGNRYRKPHVNKQMGVTHRIYCRPCQLCRHSSWLWYYIPRCRKKLKHLLIESAMVVFHNFPT